jgi:protein-S-isoprenylcysteine O-methyltransferase Ste14
MAESSLTQTLAKWRVPLGFACGALVIWMARPTLASLLWGSALALGGEGLRVWAAGHLEKGREVTRSGPYRFTRHPLYLGSGIIALGAAIASNSLAVSALIALYFTATVLSAIRSEEAGMRAAFGDQYAAYMESRAQPVERSFSARRAMMTNREYRSIGGLLVFAAILAFKALR